jgi:hypothetical protein
MNVIELFPLLKERQKYSQGFILCWLPATIINLIFCIIIRDSYCASSILNSSFRQGKLIDEVHVARHTRYFRNRTLEREPRVWGG